MKNIFLIGMPSSGKTSLGKTLARHLQYRFVDLDVMIMEKENMPIADIFQQKGEEHFRKLESALLKEIKSNDALVIATGGGTPCFYDNMAFIKKEGVSLFLDVTPLELLRRMKSSRKNERPMFNTQTDVQSLLDSLERKYQERQIFYRQADYIIQHDRIDLEMILSAIGPIEVLLEKR